MQYERVSFRALSAEEYQVVLRWDFSQIQAAARYRKPCRKAGDWCAGLGRE